MVVYTGLLKEPLVQAALNARKYTTSPVKFVPEEAVSSVKLSDGKEYMSESVEYDMVHLPSNDKMEVMREAELYITKTGVPSHATIETKLVYPNRRVTGTFESLCQPLHVPVRYIDPKTSKLQRFLGSKNTELQRGQIVSLGISYKYGSRNLSLKTILFYPKTIS